MRVPYVNLVAQHAPIRERLLVAVGQVIDHGQFILGDEVGEFERRFAQICDSPYAVGVNSGTDALMIALKGLGIGPGDEVITVPNSFVASTACIVHVGARPVFVDVGEDYNIDPDLIAAAVTGKTRAILVIHLTGRPANMDPVMEVAQRYGLHVVEDAAQAVGAEYKGKRVGAIGTVGCFSLHPLKTLNACGDGGVITTHDEKLYEEFKVLRNIGLRSRDDCVAWGYNSRLDTLQAAILLVKLDCWEEWSEGRREIARLYQDHLSTVKEIQVPIDQPHEKAVYHTFMIQTQRRDELKTYLTDSGIGTGIHYPNPIHLQQTASSLGYQPGAFPVTERQAATILSLPVYAELEQSQVEYVVDRIQRFYAQEAN
jgi:dTDP-4-amino-4,6-dideoxygalactose transaminase